VRTALVDVLPGPDPLDADGKTPLEVAQEIAATWQLNPRDQEVE